jgi:hypothetical protein
MVFIGALPSDTIMANPRRKKRGGILWVVDKRRTMRVDGGVKKISDPLCVGEKKSRSLHLPVKEQIFASPS